MNLLEETKYRQGIEVARKGTLLKLLEDKEDAIRLGFDIERLECILKAVNRNIYYFSKVEGILISINYTNTPDERTT